MGDCHKTNLYVFVCVVGLASADSDMSEGIGACHSIPGHGKGSAESAHLEEQEN